jgi:hypothetical protein
MDAHTVLSATSTGHTVLTWVAVAGAVLACGAVATAATVVVRQSRWERAPHYKRHTPSPHDDD